MRTLFVILFTALWVSIGAPLRGDDFDSDGVKIHYTAQGSGEPVVLIHGLASSAQMNWGATGVIADLAPHYEVIALDCRGHGQSDKPTTEGAYGQTMVEDVVRLMDHLHVPKAHVVGYSMGGMIAMKLAVSHPDRVSSLVLGGMGYLKEGSGLQKVWQLMGERQNGRGNPALMQGFTEFAVTEEQVRALEMPISVIVGDHDPCRRMYVDPLLSIRPDIPVQIVPDAGHIVCIMKPEFKPDIQKALAENRTKRK